MAQVPFTPPRGKVDAITQVFSQMETVELTVNVQPAHPVAQVAANVPEFIKFHGPSSIHPTSWKSRCNYPSIQPNGDGGTNC